MVWVWLVMFSGSLSVYKAESQFSVLPLPLSFARSRERKGYPNSYFYIGVGGRGAITP